MIPFCDVTCSTLFWIKFCLNSCLGLLKSTKLDPLFWVWAADCGGMTNWLFLISVTGGFTFETPFVKTICWVAGGFYILWGATIGEVVIIGAGLLIIVAGCEIIFWFAWEGWRTFDWKFGVLTTFDSPCWFTW